jgi:chaperonin GroES
MTKKSERNDSRGFGAALRPLDDRVVVKRLDAEEKTAGGIILPDAAKEKPQRGEVVAAGPGKLMDNGARATPGVAAGDIVIFGKYSGTEVKVDGVELLIMRENDILAKL